MALNFLFICLGLLILTVTAGLAVYVARFAVDTHFDWKQHKAQQKMMTQVVADVDAK